MFTSDTDPARRLCVRASARQAFLTVLTAAFGAVYEHFSFGVYSFWMLYGFLFPLCLGVLPFLLILLAKKPVCPPPSSVSLWNSGVAALTCGSLLKGALAIYGTDSPYLFVYALAGVILLLSALLLFLVSRRKSGEKIPSPRPESR